RIVESQHRSKAWIGPLVRISAIVGAFSVLVVLFVQMTAGPVALPTWERTSEPPLEAQAASVTEVPVTPSVRVGSLSASALDPAGFEGSVPRRAHIASTPGEAAPLSGAPRQPSAPRRQPSARGLETGIEALASRVTTDVNTAAVEAKGQFDDLQSKTMKNLTEMRRIWNNAAQVFSDKDMGATRSEGRAKPLVSQNSPH